MNEGKEKLTVNGIPIPERIVRGQDVLLPSGKRAFLREGTGKDVLKAQKLQGKDPDLYLFALLSVLVLIEGNPIILEHLMDMPLPDVMALQVALGTTLTTGAEGEGFFVPSAEDIAVLGLEFHQSFAELEAMSLEDLAWWVAKAHKYLQQKTEAIREASQK